MATSVLVTLAEDVDQTTVDADDVVLMAGQKACTATVQTLSSTTFTIDWTGTRVPRGTMTVTVFTSGIKNIEGKAGTTNKSRSWQTLAGYLVGDANDDDKVSIIDAVSIANKIMGNPSADFKDDAADVNGDGKITITDAVGVVDIIQKE